MTMCNLHRSRLFLWKTISLHKIVLGYTHQATFDCRDLRICFPDTESKYKVIDDFFSGLVLPWQPQRSRETRDTTAFHIPDQRPYWSLCESFGPLPKEPDCAGLQTLNAAELHYFAFWNTGNWANLHHLLRYRFNVKKVWFHPPANPQ